MIKDITSSSKKCMRQDYTVREKTENFKSPHPPNATTCLLWTSWLSLLGMAEV